MSKHWRCLENSSQQGTRGESLLVFLYSDNNKDFEKLSMGDQSFSISKQCMFVYFHEFKKCNTDIYVCYDAALLFDCQGVIS